MNEVMVYTVSVAYIFMTPEGMREHSLDKDFTLPRKGYSARTTQQVAIRSGVSWARNRLDSYMKDAYPGSSIGSVKVGTKLITSMDATGYNPGGFGGYFFEWKCDYPESLDNVVDSLRPRRGRPKIKTAAQDRKERRDMISENMLENRRKYNHGEITFTQYQKCDADGRRALRGH